MIKKAFLRANIPFSTDVNTVFSTGFLSVIPAGWVKFNVQGDSLLKHINTAFEENVVCFSKQLENVNFCLPTAEKSYDFSVNEVQVFCFDTGVGIVSLNIPYNTETQESTVVNTCSALRCSAAQDNAAIGRAIFKNGAETYLSSIAEEQLQELLGSTFTLFNHSNSNSMRRIDMFSAALCDIEPEGGDIKAFDKLCYRLGNTYDDRDKNLTLNESYFKRPQDYTRWSFSNRGCAVVSNLTGNNSTDNFLEDRWIFTVKSNYFYLYIMVLHQKYAIYNYLNTVAADKDKVFIKYNQESLIDFNSKYIFSIVSDEHFIQDVYFRMKEVNNVEEVYTDLLDELKRMFEYSQLKNEESNEIRNNRLNLISVIISVMCSITIVFDTIRMFTENGFYFGFGSKKELLCTGVIALEVLLFVGCLIFVFFVNQKRK